MSTINKKKLVFVKNAHKEITFIYDAFARRVKNPIKNICMFAAHYMKREMCISYTRGRNTHAFV